MTRQTIDLMPHVFKVHWYRAKNMWSVVFSDHCEHFKGLVIRVPVATVLQDKAPRAYLKGRGRLVRYPDFKGLENFAEIVP